MATMTKQQFEKLKQDGGVQMVTASIPFQRYTHTTTDDGTRTGKPRNKVAVLAPVGGGKHRMKILMLAGVVLPEPYITVDTLANVLSR